jgi:hypothetical protein
VRKILFGDGRQLDEHSVSVTQLWQLFPLPNGVHQGDDLKTQMGQDHREPKEQEEQENT